MSRELQKGENISLTQFDSGLNELVLAFKCLKNTDDNILYEITTSVFLLTEHEKVRSNADFIFSRQPESVNNAVILRESMVKITLSRLSTEIHKIAFVLTLDNAEVKKQHFGQLKKIVIKLFRFHDKQEIASFNLEHTYNETAIILAQLYRYNNEWKFKAVGHGFINGLGVLAEHFGASIDKAIPVTLASAGNQSPPITNHLQTQSLVNNNLSPSNNKTKSGNQSPPISNHLQAQSPVNNNLSPSNKKTTNRKKSNKSTDLTIPTADSAYLPKQINIHNTNVFSQQKHYQPILNWLKLKNINAKVNSDAMNTTGFFDEIAVALGNNYALLKIVSDTIKRRYRIGKNTAYIDLSRHQHKDIICIRKFCQELYDYAFVAKYFYNSNEKKIIFHLHFASKIVSFFNGEWLEWFAFMKIIDLCQKKKWSYSCTRNMTINFESNNQYEIDVFFLINEKPLFIECKSGEYREYIDKYSKLRKKLFIDKSRYLFLILETDSNKTEGLSTMFDMTFLNQDKLVDYVSKLSFSSQTTEPSVITQDESDFSPKKNLLSEFWTLVSKK